MNVHVADTHQSYKNLVAGGFSQDQAEAILHAVTVIHTGHLATKEDLISTKHSLEKNISDLRTDLEKQISELRADMGKLRTDLEKQIHELRTDLEKQIGEFRLEFTQKVDVLRIWVLAGMLTQTMAIIGVVLAVVK